MAQVYTKTVLVVDDEADVRNFLKAALLEAGFNVVTAEDGFDALAKVEQHIPDLISLDLVMPRKSGAIFYRELMKNKNWSKIPVIIVTGHARDELGKADLKELTMSGPGIYLEKPVKPANYIAAVKKILRMESSSEEQSLAETVELQIAIKKLIDEVDLETLKKLKKILE